MSFLFWGLTLGLVGKVLLGVAVVLVHSKVVHEHGIDKVVLHEMKRERNIALIGIALMVIGWLLELAWFGFIPGISVAAPVF